MKQPYHHGALRVALLKSAERILERDGIDGLSLRATAREAGVSHAAPAHHFGDLSGLLSELAASGFVRLRQSLLPAMVMEDPTPRLIELGRIYIRFALSSPGLYLLMFRSERLDWANPALAAAGPAAFALLTQIDADGTPHDFPTLTRAMTRWSFLHGMAVLLVDGRFGALAEKEGVPLDTMVEAVLLGGLGPGGRV
jgi:AcrR family transcriptional regulator